MEKDYNSTDSDSSPRLCKESSRHEKDKINFAFLVIALGLVFSVPMLVIDGINWINLVTLIGNVILGFGLGLLARGKQDDKHNPTL